MKSNLASPKNEIKHILQKTISLDSLSDKDIDKLIYYDWENDTELNHDLILLADNIRERTLGNTIHLVIPLYISNYCVSNCPYCANRESNRIKRNRLNFETFQQEIKNLINIGYRTIELVLSEDKSFSLETLTKYINYLRKEFDSVGGGMICLNTPTYQKSQLNELKNAGVDILILWQETYCKERYEYLHNFNSIKNDYDFRFGAQNNALRSGMVNVGIGVLWGLYDYKKDLKALIQHGQLLSKEYGIYPTFGIPRIKKAFRAPYVAEQYEVNNKQLKWIVAILRIVFKHSHIFISTREKIGFMAELMRSGGGNITAAMCNVSPWGYTEGTIDHRHGQFEVFSYSPEIMKETLLMSGLNTTFSPPIFFQRNK